MFWQDLDPGYYQNPSAYTYLTHGLLRVLYGPLGFLFPLAYGNVTEQFAKDPGEIWIAARTLAAGLCMGGVLATYFAARRLWGVREGLVAAAVLAFAFLPVAYSRVAVTDVGALIGVPLALLFAVRAHEEDRLRDWALAGAAAGLATAFKYTAGLALLPLAGGAARAAGLAATWRARAGRAGGRGGVRAVQPLPVRLAGRLVERPARPGRRGRQRPQARAGVGRPGLLPREPDLGARLGGDGRGAGGRGAAGAARPRARADADRAAAGAVRLPGRAVALLRALAAARLSRAGAAGGLRGGAGGGARTRPRVAAGGAGRRARAGGDRPAADRRRAHGPGARPRGHAQPGARLPRRALRARAAGVDRAGGAGPLLPLQPRGTAAALAGPLRAPRGLDRARLVLRGRGRAACLRAVQARPVRASRRRRARLGLPRRARARRWWTTCACTATAT